MARDITERCFAKLSNRRGAVVIKRFGLYPQCMVEADQLRNADAVDEARPLTAITPQAGAASSTDEAAAPPTSSAEVALTVCVAGCSTTSMPHDAARAVARALNSVAVVRTVLLSETGTEPTHDVEVIMVPHGTKLSKIRRLADLIDADVFCICDPDLTVEEEACRVILQLASADVRAGREVVAFGIVEGKDDGTLLSQVVAVDKWLSHRVLRRFLWAAGIGITLPGQFLLLSPSLLRSIDPGVDSYLDDLCLGWLARQRGVRVHRVAIVVGEEDSRSRWASLVTQRVRWMRGIASLFGHFASHPSAIGLLGVHYLAYHGLPIFVMAAVAFVTVVSPLPGLCVFFSLSTTLSVFAGRSFVAAVTFLGAFPVVHALATLLWWVLLSRTMLTRR